MASPDFKLEVLAPATFKAPQPHRIVPVRFARAVSGFADDSAPDLDDHGFTVASDFGPARGPTVGVIQNRAIRVKVIRDRIAANAKLFAVSDDDAIASVESPAAGTALSALDVPADAEADCVQIRGTSSSPSTAETKIKLRYGTADGPVVAELAVRVYPLLTIPVQAHSVTINGTPSGTGIDQVRKLFESANKVWAQAGIAFSVRADFPTETVTGFERAGSVSIPHNVNSAQSQELQTVLNLNRRPGTLNAYFFVRIVITVNNIPVSTDDNGPVGAGFSRDRARANPAAPPFPGCSPGMAVTAQGSDPARANTVAHELGHMLRLEHYNNGNTELGRLTDVRNDIWAHRNLMHNVRTLDAAPSLSHYASSPARIVVGYGHFPDGTISRGMLLMSKKRAGVFQSEQIDIVRRAALAGSFAPL